MLPKDKNRFALDLMVVATVCMAVAFLHSCVSVNKAKKVMDRNVWDAAEYCASKFPTVDSVIEIVTVTKYDTVYTEADTLIFIDTVVLNSGEVRIDTIVKKCPPQKTIVKTVIEKQKVVIVDSAKLMACQGEYLAIKSDRDKHKEKSKTRLRNFWISIGANLLLAVALGFVLGKKINIGLFKNKKP